MTEWFGVSWIHPSFVLIVGALFIPLLQGTARQIYQVALPLLTFAIIVSMPKGEYGVIHFLNLTMITGRVDELSLVFAYIFGLILVIGSIYALHVKEALQHVAGYIYAGSALGVVFAGDLITLYCFWEIMVFSSVWLIWCRRDAASWKAGWRYVLVHAVGGMMLLAGIVLQFHSTGSTAFVQIDAASPAFYFILIGFVINAAVPPLHAWLPDAYPEATVTGAILLSAFTTKTAVYTLLRGYPGTELLIWAGAFMALYGVVYANLVNDIRRLLAYHIVSQVGFMVAGVGMGTLMAVNGAASHAFAHILYKALLFMGAGAVIYMTGRSKLTELGGLYKYMPITFVLYMIGGFAISAVPLTSGFVTKTMTIEAAALTNQAAIWLMLSMASAGTFLSTVLKLPYYTFLGQDSGLKPKEAPVNMLVAMGIAAFLCIFIGVYPQWLYEKLPSVVNYNAYSYAHILYELQFLLFTGLAFFLMLKHLGAKEKISLDTDWLYRRVGAYWNYVARYALNWGWKEVVGGIHSASRVLHREIYRLKGPEGALGRAWPTGLMTFWATVMVGAYLLIGYFYFN